MRFEPEEQQRLLALARASLTHGLQSGQALAVQLQAWPAHLCEPAATFVTLRRAHRLQGCIGTLEPYRPLVQDIASNAYAAGVGDPRFVPLQSTELAEISFEVSVLTPLQALSVASEQALLERLTPGVDGLILEWQGRWSTFLPAVWQQLPQPRDFLSQLWLKAGLEPGFWARGITCYRYRTICFQEENPLTMQGGS